MADAQKKREWFWTWWGFEQCFLLCVALFLVAIVSGMASMFITLAAAEQPSGITKFVLHVEAETCEDAVSVFPLMTTEWDGWFNSSATFFALTSDSCVESDESALSVHVTDEYVYKKIDTLYLVADRSDPESRFLIGRTHVQRVDFEHEWLGTLDLTGETATHLPPQAHPDLMARIGDRQDCGGDQSFRFFHRDCGVEWAQADLRTFEALP